MNKKEVANQWVWGKAKDLEDELDNLIPGSESVGYTVLLVAFLTDMLKEVGIKATDCPGKGGRQ